MSISTSQIMHEGLELAGWKKLPKDSSVHVPGKKISRVLMAIDVGTAEILLAKQLGCDGVIAHHPIGIASVNFHKVFDRHIEFMVESGVEYNIARRAVEKLKERVANKAHSEIYDQVVGAARALKMPLVNIHQPCDEYMRKAVLSRIRDAKANKISDILRSVGSIPEFSNSSVKPAVRIGKPSDAVRKLALVIAAGTNGGYAVAKAFFEAAVDTVIYLHVDYGELVKLREDKARGSLVVLGHLAGDSVGMNGLGARLESLGVETIRVGILRPN